MIVPYWIHFIIIPIVFPAIFLYFYKKFKLDKKSITTKTLYFIVLGMTTFATITVLGLATFNSDLMAIISLYPFAIVILFIIVYYAIKGLNTLLTNIINSSDDISASVQESNASAMEISASIQEISDYCQRINLNTGNITHVIKFVISLSDELKLLSLNARIEAGRAGEKGKGFSAVADEFTELSKKVIDNVKGSFFEADKIIESISTLTGELESISVAVEGLSQNIESISDSTTKLSNKTRGNK